MLLAVNLSAGFNRLKVFFHHRLYKNRNPFNAMPLLSVIIPTYNRAHTLPRALDSVLAQRHPVDEVVVVDDGSTDCTVELIQHRYPQVKLIQQQHRGVSAARNRGISASCGEWIALLDSDDEWLPHKLEKQLALLSQQPEQKIVHSDEIWIRNGVRVNPMNKHRKQGEWMFKACLPLCVISPSAAIIHRSVFAVVGQFDETLPACEDYDLWLRITCRYPVLYCDVPLINKFGGHEDQLSRKHWGMDRFRIQALIRILEQGVLNEADYQAALEVLLGKIQVVLGGARKRGNREVIMQYDALLQQWSGACGEQVSRTDKLES